MDDAMLDRPLHDACRLCGSTAELLFAARALGRYPAGYYRCPACDLIQTERPFWLDEAYGSALSEFDTGCVARDRLCTELTLSLAWLLGVGRDAPCLDYGGGHGVLARGMRDRGYNFRCYDKYAENRFARGFEGDPAQRQVLLTCFEVWEHLPDAGTDLERIFRPGHDAVLAGTVLHRCQPENWWYYCPEAGQHVAFYSARTMAVVAQRFGYQAIIGRQYTLFHKPGLLRGWRRGLAAAIIQGRTGAGRNSRAALLSLALRPRLPSRTWDDHVDLMKRRQQLNGHEAVRDAA
jgi:hypothetical protein